MHSVQASESGGQSLPPTPQLGTVLQPASQVPESRHSGFNGTNENRVVSCFVRLMHRNLHALRAGVRVGGPIAAPQHPSLAPSFSLLRRYPNLVIPALTERTAIASIRRIPAPHPFGANASVVQICSRQICPGSSVLSPTSLSANPSLHSSLRLKNNVPEKVNVKTKR